MTKRFFAYITSLWSQFEQNIVKWGIDPYSLAFMGVGFILGVTSGAMLLLGIGAAGVMLPPLGLLIFGAGIVGASVFFGLKCFLDSWARGNKMPSPSKELCQTYKLLQKHDIAGLEKNNQPEPLAKTPLPEHAGSPAVLPTAMLAMTEGLAQPCQFVKNAG